MKIKNFLKLIIAIAICELAGVAGSLFTMPAIRSGWYAGLVKPELAPPNWIFGPVWTILFAFMGVSAWLIWRELDSRESGNDSEKSGNKKQIKIALIVFDTQLLLNVFWSIIFFGWRSLGGAFVEIIFLWFAILATIILFAKISRPAAWLLAPYIIWVSFAGYLNFSIWQLSSDIPKAVQCAMEAKLCSDGSAVGRIGPNCEFAKCPEEVSYDDKTLIEKYLRENIKTLAPEEPVLGGSWYVVSVEIDTSENTGTVVYEDGHIQGKAAFHYSRTDDVVIIDMIKKQ